MMMGLQARVGCWSNVKIKVFKHHSFSPYNVTSRYVATLQVKKIDINEWDFVLSIS